jgi:hypothetical protein
MAATISSSPRDHSSPLEPANTSPAQIARTLVEDYAKEDLKVSTDNYDVVIRIGCQLRINSI